MRAIQYSEYGPSSVLQLFDLPAPAPVDGKLLVKVDFAGINPIDWKVRSGAFRDFFPQTLPVIPLGEFSGTIIDTGGVPGFEPGEDIFGLAPGGAAAEQILVDVIGIARRPENLTQTDAGGVALAALTAWQALFDFGGLVAGQKVLIHAAAGGVGSYAVQFARWAGATVYATASEKHHEYLKLLGADEVIDYHKVAFEDVVSDVDVVLSSVHGETEERSYGVLKPGGILVSVVGGGENVPEGVRFASLRMQPKEGQLAKIAGLIQEGHVRASTEVVLPLESIGEAQDRSEAGRTRGKIIIRVER